MSQKKVIDALGGLGQGEEQHGDEHNERVGLVHYFCGNHRDGVDDNDGQLRQKRGNYPRKVIDERGAAHHAHSVADFFLLFGDNLNAQLGAKEGES